MEREKLQQVVMEAGAEFICEKDGAIFFRSGKDGDAIALDCTAVRGAPDIRLAVTRASQGKLLNVRRLSAKRKKEIFQLKLQGVACDTIANQTGLAYAVVMRIISEGER